MTVLSFAEARAAAASVREAEYAREAEATMRPRSALGLVRSRAPLPLMIYVAAREGRLVRAGGDGLAVLEPPSLPAWPAPPGLWPRVLRFVDRRWDLLWFAGPPLLGLLAAAALIPFRPLWIVALILAVLAIGYLAVFMAGQALYAIGGLATSGRAERRPGEAAAASEPAYFWSVPLCHQSDPARVDELVRLIQTRLIQLISGRVASFAGTLGAHTGRVEVIETVICLTRGVTTSGTRAALSRHVRADHPHQIPGDVILLLSPDRLRARRRPVVGGGFLLLYLAGLGVAVAVLAVFVAGLESAACSPDACAGRPATVVGALRWLSQRLLLTDPEGLSPATTQAWVMGWLTSLAGLMTLPVAFVAARQQIRLVEQRRQSFDQFLSGVTARSRVLLLVVTPRERQAVIDSVMARTGQSPSASFMDDRTIHAVGRIGGADILLAQAGELGPGTPVGMTLTAADAIDQTRPDYVILTGTCYGLRPEWQRLGDIVFARRVADLDPTHVGDRDGEPVVRTTGVTVQPSHVLIDRCSAAHAGWPPDRAAVHSGLLLSASTLVNSAPRIEELRTRYPDAVGGEMEGIAVYTAATHRRADWIVVKGISDWGRERDHREPGEIQAKAAARNAADFVTHMIALGALDRRRQS